MTNNIYMYVYEQFNLLSIDKQTYTHKIYVFDFGDLKDLEGHNPNCLYSHYVYRYKLTFQISVTIRIVM